MVTADPAGTRVPQSPPRGAPGLKLAAEQAGSFPEPGQSDAATRNCGRTGRRAEPVVGHLDHDPVVAIGQVDRCRGARRIPHRIGQAFLHHPVASQLDGSRQRAGLAVHAQLSSHTRFPGSLDQAGDVTESRLR